MAIERMKTPGSVAWSCMRTRSPRMAPPLKGDGGIDGQDRDLLVLGPEVPDQRARERRLAGTLAHR